MSQSKMPPAESSGFVPTLNKMGYMTLTLDYFSKKWIEYAGQDKRPALEIGAAYGVATIPALEAGAKVTANDIEAEHLNILRDRTPEAFKSQLSLAPGSFPDALSFADGVFGSILVCRVLHFFDGPKLEKAFATMASWLAKGGRVYAVTETPYLRNFQEFIPVYQKRQLSGEKYPGFVADVMDVAPERGKTLPKTIHFLDVNVFTRLAESVGLKVIECHTIARPDFPKDLQWDGRESVGLIAEKI